MRRPCFIIAEAGSNHNGDDALAHRLIDAAAGAGADAVKFQLFRARDLYAAAAGRSDYLGSMRSIYDIIREMELPVAWLDELSRHCLDRAIAFMATGFDEASVDRLDPYVAVHKCASYEMTHHPLLAHVAGKGKPLLMSTGTATLEEVREAVRVAEAADNRRLTLLQCTASYPTPLDQVNVLAMTTLARELGYPVGLSDHSREPTIAPAAAVALGATVIEKHFTLDNTLPGPDHAFAVEPHELAAMVAAIRATERVLGHGRKETLPAEVELRGFARRSIFTRRDIRAGEVLDKSNVAVLRCGKLPFGLPPSAYPAVLGRQAVRDLTADTSLSYDDLA
jgi:N-acetylneuraminate synthase